MYQPSGFGFPRTRSTSACVGFWPSARRTSPHCPYVIFISPPGVRSNSMKASLNSAGKDVSCGHPQGEPLHSPTLLADCQTGAPGPTLQPRESRPPLTFNLLRGKLDLKGDPKDAECLARRVGPGPLLVTLWPAQSSTPQLSLLSPSSTPASITQDLLPSTLTPSCPLPSPYLPVLRALGLTAPKPDTGGKW